MNWSHSFALFLLLPITTNALSFSQAGKVYARDCNTGSYFFTISKNNKGSLNYLGWISPTLRSNFHLTSLLEEGNQVTFTIIDLDSNQTQTIRASLSSVGMQIIEASVNGKTTIQNSIILSSNTPSAVRYQCGPTTISYKTIYPNLNQETNSNNNFKQKNSTPKGDWDDMGNGFEVNIYNGHIRVKRN